MTWRLPIDRRLVFGPFLVLSGVTFGQKSPTESDLDALIRRKAGATQVTGNSSKEYAANLAERDQRTAEDAKRHVADLERRRDKAINVARSVLSGEITDQYLDYATLGSRLGLAPDQVDTPPLKHALRAAFSKGCWLHGTPGHAVVGANRCAVSFTNSSADGGSNRVFLREDESGNWKVVGFDMGIMVLLGAAIEGSDKEENCSVARVVAESFVRDEWTEDIVDWQQIQRSLGLPEDVEWGREAADSYLHLTSNELKRVGSSPVEISKSKDACVARVVVPADRKDTTVSARSNKEGSNSARSFDLELRHSGAGPRFKITGFSPEVFRVIGSLPESNFAILAEFRKFRAAFLTNNTHSLLTLLNPEANTDASPVEYQKEKRTIAAMERDLHAKLALCLEEFRRQGIDRLLRIGGVMGVDREKDRCLILLADKETVGMIEMRRTNSNWYVANVRPGIAFSHNRRQAKQARNE